MVLFVFFASAIHAACPPLERLINPLLSQYLENSHVDDATLSHSRKLLIDSLDPKKIYFLEEEVDAACAATVTLNSSEILDSYVKIIDTFHGAVCRAQKFRNQISFSTKHDLLAIPQQDAYAKYAFDLADLFTRVIADYAKRVLAFLPAESVSVALKKTHAALLQEEAPWISLRCNDISEEQAAPIASLIFRSLFAELDTHSEVLQEEEARRLQERLTKRAYGTGIYGELTPEGYRVEKIVAGSPAEKVLCRGDFISTINGICCSSLSEEAIQRMLHENSFIPLVLSIHRSKTQSSFLALVKRTPFLLNEGRVSLQRYPGSPGEMVVVRFDEFYKGAVSTTEDFIQAMPMNHPPNGIILDLRRNGGGYLAEAVKFAGLFIHTGVISTIYYSNGQKAVLRDLDPTQLYSGPILVLVSEQTASAAEVVAQALKDYGRAIIVGTKTTYGKGSAQFQNVTFQSQLAAKFTVGYLFGISGTSHQGTGVRSDIVLTQDTFSHPHEIVLHKKLAATFADTIEDISSKNRAWYQSHYLPFLEKKTDRYRKYIPLLQERNHNRALSSSGNDIVLERALLILKDLIQLTNNDTHVTSSIVSPLEYSNKDCSK
jgi:carboxyl-terminal processing protease